MQLDLVFILHLLNSLLMISLPIGLGIYLTRRFKLGWRLWLIGAATFALSQAGHIPFNALASNLLNQTEMVNWTVPAQLIFNALFLGLSAGIWEEGARYFMYRLWAREARSWRKGILTGAGHGGVESILVGLLAFYVFMQLFALRGTDLATIFPADQLELARQQITSYWSASWYDSILGALERLLTLPIQIALAALVIQVFIRKQTFWIWLAVGFHALVNTTAVLAANYFSPYVTEMLIGFFTIVSLGIIFALRQPEPEPEPEIITKPMLLKELSELEETPDNLEKTRYQ